MMKISLPHEKGFHHGARHVKYTIEMFAQTSRMFPVFPVMEQELARIGSYRSAHHNP
jgi:hypothetical protein